MDLLFDRCSWWSYDIACSCTCKLCLSVSSFAARLVVCEQQICHKLMKSAALTESHPTPPLCLPAFVLKGGAGQSSTPQFPSFVRSWNTNMISWRTREDKDQNNWRINIYGEGQISEIHSNFSYFSICMGSL